MSILFTLFRQKGRRNTKGYRQRMVTKTILPGKNEIHTAGTIDKITEYFANSEVFIDSILTAHSTDALAFYS
jgi:hypothetical protein